MRTTLWVGLAALLGLTLGSVIAWGQDDHPKIQDTLEEFIDRQNPDEPPVGLTSAPSELSPEFRLFKQRVRGERVRVVIEASDDRAVEAVQTAVRQRDGRVEMAYKTSIQADVPIGSVAALAEHEGTAFVRLPVRPRRGPTPMFKMPLNKAADAARAAQNEVTSEGLDVIGADAWHDAGLTGEGINVGIIDTGFRGYRNLLGSDLPSAEHVATKSFREDGSLECSDCSENDQLHGKGVAEIVHDLAPDARQTLANLDFTDVSFRRAVDWMIDQEVDVINTSVWFASGCFGKGEGLLEPQIAEARQNGIAWASSGGNFGGGHWQGNWQDPNNNGRHNFTSSDDTFTVEVEFQEAEVDGQRVAAVEFYSIIGWEADCGNADNDYRTVVYPEFDPSIRVEGDWVWRPGIPIKSGSAFIWSNDTSRIGTTTRLHLAIEKTDPSAPDARLDMLITGCPTCAGGEFDRLTSAGSISIQEPAKSSNVTAAGAAHHSPSQCPRDMCPDGRLLFYSDRGPTKDGRTKPDIAAPTHVSTNAYGRWTGFGQDENSGFGGTSAASPHVAGAMALVQQAFPNLAPKEIDAILTNQAEDVGSPGEDNNYGAGLMTLGQAPGQKPAIDGIEPASGVQGATIEAVISGTNMSEATEVTFSGSGVTAEIRDGASDAELPIAIEIAPDAPTGKRTFTVTTPNGQVDSGSVMFTVLQGPELNVVPADLAFSAVAGGDAPDDRSIEITNAGGGTLTWEATANVDWIDLGTTSGTAPATVDVQIEPSDLEPGQHQGTIVVRAPSAQGSPARVTVALDLTEPPELVVNPAPPDLDFGQLSTGETATRTVTLSNTGGGTLNWQALSESAWVSFSPTDGALSRGASQEVEVAVVPSNLDPGKHTATIRFEAGNQSVTGTVRVTVGAQPTAGGLLVLEFVKLAFMESSDWEPTVLNGCVRYANASDGPSPIEVTRPDGTVETYEVPAGNEVLVCGGVVHIDTRHSAENQNV